jgi:hypothetical protein
MSVPLEPPLTWGAVPLESPLPDGSPSLESPLAGGGPPLESPVSAGTPVPEFRWPQGFILGWSMLGVDYLGATHGVYLEDSWDSWGVPVESPLVPGGVPLEPPWSGGVTFEPPW